MDKRKSPKPSTRQLTLRGKHHHHQHSQQQVVPSHHATAGAGTAATSDSDGSAETNSLSADSITELPAIHAVNTQVQIIVQQGTAIKSGSVPLTPTMVAPSGGRTKKGGSGGGSGGGGRRRSSEWEIMEGLKDGQKYDKKPTVYSGYLHKKRKWPLKGWHKRYFNLDKGILIYGKGPVDLAKAKVHGSVDIALSVISSKSTRRRLDIDAEECIYHVKAKTAEAFACWLQQLTAHRLYRQHVLTYGNAKGVRTSAADAVAIGMGGTAVSPTDERKLILTPDIISATAAVVNSRDGSLTRGLKLLGHATTATNVVISPSTSRLANALLDAGIALDQAHRDTALIDLNLTQLSRMLDAIAAMESSGTGQSSGGLGGSVGETESLGEGLSSNVKKGKKFGLKKKKSSKGGSVDLTMTFNRTIDPDNTSPLSANSAMSISPIACGTGALNNGNSFSVMPIGGACAANLPIADHHTHYDRHSYMGMDSNREDFIILAKNVLSSLRSVTNSINSERDRLRGTVEAEAGALAMTLNHSLATSLRSSLNQAMQQNAELKSRLGRLHELSDINDMSSLDPVSDTQHRAFNTSQQLSYSSSCLSGSEFFDAEELDSPAEKAVLPSLQATLLKAQPSDDVTDVDGLLLDAAEVRTRGSDSSSEAEGSLSSGEGGEEEEEGSISSESELGVHGYGELGGSNGRDGGGGGRRVSSLQDLDGLGSSQGLTGRRTQLAAPRPDTEGLSLWNLLCKNIGKDLSQISMPVALNEPLNMLQRLCEELEYSELLDKAAEIDDPYERMIQVAAFAVSAYAASLSRAGNKPFNPLLGETFECIREDKGFRFLAEQVSHHPPVSACHAESRNFTFWQEARIKTKFWGKSMEFQPTGAVHVLLPRTGDLYTYNKMTTCVHNLFSNQRWVDQYGELRISNGRISCRLTFSKASYWSAKRYEIVGAVYDEHNQSVHKLFGKWSEALYSGVAPAAKCVWRAGTMPADHDRYYGFTRFALELNELMETERHLLPPTDTRFRPDQRALEEGDLSAAERLKHQLESSQRDRRKPREELQNPLWFSHSGGTSTQNVHDDNSIAVPGCSTATTGEIGWAYNGKYWEYRRREGGFQGIHFERLW